MSTGQTPSPAIQAGSEPQDGNADKTIHETALTSLSPEPGLSELGVLKGPIARLPVELDVAVPVREFRVRNLLALEPGRIIESKWANGEDVPLAAGNVQLAWSEFEVIESQLAVRITRLV